MNVSHLQVTPDQCSKEPVTQIFREQTIAKTQSAGTFEFGFAENRLSPYHYRAGEMILCNQDVEEWVRWLGPLEISLFRIPQRLLQISADELGIRDARLRGSPRLDDPRVARLLEALEADNRMGNIGGALYTETVTLALSTALLQTNGQANKALPRPTDGLTPIQLRRIRDFVAAHSNRNISLVEMAALVDLSPSYFATQFRRTTSLTPHVFVLHERIAKAKSMMRSSESGILQIAMECGFRSQQHFARVFRQQVGMSPTEFRKHAGRLGSIRLTPR